MAALRCLVASLILVACGTPRPPGALQPGERVAVVLDSPVTAELSSRKVSADGVQNVAGGAAAGCAQGIAESGIWILAPMVLPAGIAVCSIAGIGVDAVASSIQRPASREEPLTQPISDDLETRSAQARFQDALNSELEPRFRVVPENDRADSVLYAQLNSIQLAKYPGEYFSLRMDASTRVSRSGQRGPVVWRRVLIETQKRSKGDITSEDGALLLADLDAGLAALAAQLVQVALKPERER